MSTVRIGQVYEDRDYGNATHVWGPEVGGVSESLGIQKRQLVVVEISDQYGGPDSLVYVKVRQLKGKRPGHESWMKVTGLLGKSRSHGFDLVQDA